MKRAPAAVLLMVLGAAPSAARAQDSQFGIQGLGMPGRWESVRARATGGAFAPFDPFSPLMEASVADVRRVTAGITTGTSWRTTDLAGVPDATLRATRFPAFVLAGPVVGRLILGVGFSTYLDKSFGITTSKTDTLRGVPVNVTDQITSDGAVADLRLAAAARLNSRLALGVAIHGLTGSTRVVARREFEDSTYRTSIAREDVAYNGFGGSASALLDLGANLRLAGWARSDTRLRADVSGRTAITQDLPFAAGAAIRWRAGSEAAVAGAVAWRYWSGADTTAYDTFSWSLGAELGAVRLPLRLGVRGGQLPFGPGGTAPTEFAIAAGFGRQFSQDRGRLDFTLERLDRKGAGLTEHVWSVLFGLTIRP